MERKEIDGLITSGPILATYGAFRVRPLHLTETGHPPRQLSSYLISVQIAPHAEVACTRTTDSDASEEAVVRAVLDQLNEDYNVLTNFPYPWGCPWPRVVDGIGPRSDEDPAIRQAYSDRFIWMCEGLGTVADVVTRLEPELPVRPPYEVWGAPATPAADRGGITSIIPEEEAILLATFGPFQVVRTVDWRMVLFPFPYALWHEPWKPNEVLTAVQVRFDAGEQPLQKLRTSLEEYDNPVTRAEVIAAWRGYIDSRRTADAVMAAGMTAFNRARTGIDPARVRRSSYQLQQEEAIAKLTVAVEALEAEEAAERAGHGDAKNEG